MGVQVFMGTLPQTDGLKSRRQFSYDPPPQHIDRPLLIVPFKVQAGALLPPVSSRPTDESIKEETNHSANMHEGGVLPGVTFKSRWNLLDSNLG